jgi:hypothetical protein
MHTQTQALDSDFFFFAYAIPVMLAICSRTTEAGLKSFAWLDAVQALIAVVLAYFQLFSVLPSHAHPKAISAVNLMYLNNAENVILIGAVTLRFFSNPSPARRRFYRDLSVYLWVNGIVGLTVGYFELEHGWHSGVQDAGWGIPYLALMGSFVLQHKTPTDRNEPSNGQQTVGLLIDNLSPLLFTLAITVMGIKIAPEHPRLGFVCISTAVAIYGVRAAILQVRYARSQGELSQASRAKSQFLANMSHEIRTPMNGILGMTELALSTNLSEEQREFLLTGKSSADRLLTIINEILDYSKMEAGKTVLDYVAFHLPSVVKDVVRRRRPGQSGNVSLYVDGKKDGEGRLDMTVPMIYSADETCNVGRDEGAPVSPDYGSRDNGFSGTVNWVRLDLAEDDHSHLISPEERLQIAMARQ